MAEIDHAKGSLTGPLGPEGVPVSRTLVAGIEFAPTASPVGHRLGAHQPREEGRATVHADPDESGRRVPNCGGIAARGDFAGRNAIAPTASPRRTRTAARARMMMTSTRTGCRPPTCLSPRARGSGTGATTRGRWSAANARPVGQESRLPGRLSRALRGVRYRSRRSARRWGSDVRPEARAVDSRGVRGRVGCSG